MKICSAFTITIKVNHHYHYYYDYHRYPKSVFIINNITSDEEIIYHYLSLELSLCNEERTISKINFAKVLPLSFIFSQVILSSYHYHTCIATDYALTTPEIIISLYSVIVIIVTKRLIFHNKLQVYSNYSNMQVIFRNKVPMKLRHMVSEVLLLVVLISSRSR